MSHPHPYANLIGWGIGCAVILLTRYAVHKTTLERFGKAFNEYRSVLQWMLWLQIACIVISFFLINGPAGAIGAIFLFANVALWWAVAMLLCMRPHPHLFECVYFNHTCNNPLPQLPRGSEFYVKNQVRHVIMPSTFHL